MTALAGPFAIVALVLAVGGAFKVRDPAPTAHMLGSVGLPPSRALARVSGLVEIIVGLTAVVVGGRWAAAAVALLYLLFAALTARLLRVAPTTSCGCFGQLSSSASVVHVAANLVAAATTVAALLVGVDGFVELRNDQPAGGAPFAALVAVGTWMFVMVITVLPDTLAAARRVPALAPVPQFTLSPLAATRSDERGAPR
jgi:hypothetical protein